MAEVLTPLDQQVLGVASRVGHVMALTPDWRAGADPLSVVEISTDSIPFGGSEAGIVIERAIDPKRDARGKPHNTTELQSVVSLANGGVLFIAVGIGNNDGIRILKADAADETILPGETVDVLGLTNPRYLRRGTERSGEFSWPLGEGRGVPAMSDEEAVLTEQMTRDMLRRVAVTNLVARNTRKYPSLGQSNRIISTL